jgi:hypothetical protein
MSVKFCFARGWAPRPFTCGMDIPSPLTGSTPIRLGDLGGLTYKTYTPEFLRARVEVSESLSDDTKEIWRNRIICILAVENVFCINFIPSDPNKSQILQVMRLKDPEANAASIRVYCCDYSPYKFMMPKESPDQVFELGRWDISQTVAHLKSDSLISIVTKAIGYLIQDRDLTGLVITFENQKTYIWLKGK